MKTSDGATCKGLKTKYGTFLTSSQNLHGHDRVEFFQRSLGNCDSNFSETCTILSTDVSQKTTFQKGSNTSLNVDDVMTSREIGTSARDHSNHTLRGRDLGFNILESAFAKMHTSKRLHDYSAASSQSKSNTTLKSTHESLQNNTCMYLLSKVDRSLYLCSSAKREFSVRIRVVLLRMSKLLDTVIRVSCCVRSHLARQSV